MTIPKFSPTGELEGAAIFLNLQRELDIEYRYSGAIGIGLPGCK